MATTPAWNDPGHIGRALNRNFTYLETLTKKEMKKKTPDVERIQSLNSSMVVIAGKLYKWIEMFDTMPRIENLEKLIDHVPSHVLAEAKAKAGV